MRYAIKNKLRNIEPVYVGGGESTKIVCNTGLAQTDLSFETQFEKVKAAVNAGADIVGDASLNNNYRDYLSKLLNELNVPLSTVPLYGTYVNAIKDKGGFAFAETKDFLDEIEFQAKLGVDVMTIHSDFNKYLIDEIKNSGRLIKMTSRGGNYLAAYMIKNRRENPYYEYYDEILDIAKEYDIALSIGASIRTATICDGLDALSLRQVELQSQLAERALKKGVKVMIEGFGHMPAHLIPAATKMYKEACKNAPLRVLPVATDAAAGFEHINGAIAAAISVMNGADILCTVTRAEHLGLPRVEDTVEAVKAFKIAAHIGDIARLQSYDLDAKISKARKDMNWKDMYKYSILPKEAEALHKELSGNVSEDIECTMCGTHCALKMLAEYFKEDADSAKRIVNF